MTQDPSDEAILLESLENPEVFEVLISRYERRAYGLIHRLGVNTQDTEDLFQTVWTKVFAARLSFRNQSRFSTWFYAICLNTVREWRRSLARRPTPESLDEDLHSSGMLGQAWARLRGQLLRRDLERSLERLEPADREVIVLRYFEDMDDAAVGKVLGIPTARVRVKLHRALKKLRRYEKN